MGAFVNASAVGRRLLGRDKIHLLCSGTRGQFGRDDILLAGLLVDGSSAGRPALISSTPRRSRPGRIGTRPSPSPTRPGPNRLAPELLARQLRGSLGGRNLTALGLEADILTAAQIDCSKVVPELDPGSFRIRGTTDGNSLFWQ